MPKLAKTKELIQRLVKAAYPEDREEVEKTLVTNSDRYLDLLNRLRWGESLKSRDVGELLSQASTNPPVSRELFQHGSILLPNDVRTFRGLDEPFKLIPSYQQSTTTDEGLARGFAAPGGVLAQIEPGEHNLVLPNPFSGDDEWIVPPKKRFKLLREDPGDEDLEKTMVVKRLQKAKGGKASALDAAIQYVKNKLPQTGFFSTLDELIGQAPFEKAPYDQWKNYLKPGRTFEREGVRFPLKQEELDYTLGYLDQQDPEGDIWISPKSVLTKDQLRQRIQESRPDLRLRVGVPETYPGIGAERFPAERAIEDEAVDSGAERIRDTPTVREALYADYAHGTKPGPGEEAAPYEESWIRSHDFGPYSTHFGKDVISHSRTTIHPTMLPGTSEPTADLDISEQGVRHRLMRLIEEIQSDRHQRAAERVWDERIGDRMDATPEQLAAQPRRGYRTLDDEREMRQLREKELDLRNALAFANSQSRRRPNGPLDAEHERVLTRLKQLEDTVPDAPFKDPADYATLELRNQMLNAAKQGQDYLGLIRGSDVSDRFSHDPEQRTGTAYTYDKVYRSALDKLAKQYGIEVRDVPTLLKRSVDVATPTMRDLDSETMNDFLGGARDVLESYGGPDGRDLMGNPVIEQIGRVINELSDQVPSSAFHARQSLDNFVREYRENSNFDHPDVKSWWEQLKDDMQTAHEDYSDKLRTKFGATQTKSFPSMVLTPEVREKILKAGVPIWALSGATAAGALMNRDPGTQDYADGGIAKLRSMAENVGTKDTIDRRKRILSGLASQWFGINPDTGKVEFLGGASLLPHLRSMDEIRNRYKQYGETGEVPQDGGPGIFDEVQSMFLGSDRAKEADARLAALKTAIQGQMGVGDPHGFGENFDEALGTMLGQLPVPASASKAKLVEKIPFVQRLKSAAKEIPDSIVEWFSPTIQPSVKNYLAGSTVGGGIGALADMGEDDTPPVKKAEGGEVTKPLHEMLGLLKSRLNELSGVPNAQQIGQTASFDGSSET